MERRWNYVKFQFICFVVLILGLQLKGSSSLNIEGLILLKIRATIYLDPHNSLVSWDPKDDNPCNWLGIKCVNNEVQTLDLSGLSLGGTLAPEFGNLTNLRALVLHDNHFSGCLPMEFGYLTELEVLDLRNNNLTGNVPVNIAKMVSLKQLLLTGNNFKGPIPSEFEELNSLSEFQIDENLVPITSQKVDHWQKHHTKFWLDHGNHQIGNFESTYVSNMLQDQEAHAQASVLERKLDELHSNLEAIPTKFNSLLAQVTLEPIYLGSGSFSVIIKERNLSQPIPLVPSNSNLQQVNKPTQSTQDVHVNYPEKRRSSVKLLVHVIVGLAVTTFLAFFAFLILIWRSRGKRPIGPFKTGISGQLQKALIAGVPKLNRPELETACEDFSNIIATFDAFTIYKGTLSSGVEIAVASTLVASSPDWPESAELAFRKKIETLSRVNHKNYVNLLGYCAEEEPFTRMLVYEYASSGSLFEHLHVKEVEHLDWSARIRVIMGVTYCLQYMHHDLNPLVVHPRLRSTSVYLTDDFAAKITEKPFETIPNDLSGEDISTEQTDSKISLDPKENVYDFGILLLEIITGRLPYSEEHGSLIDWASPYLNNMEKNKDLIDPLLKSVKTKELEVICKVIQECIKPNPLERPTMREITSSLKEVIHIEPDAAVPQLSPLWWAELEILSESN